MVLRHWPPKSPIQRVIPVITHDEVVVHLKGIALARLSVNIDLAVDFVYGVAFITLNEPSV
jgi:hypothetical protein